MGYWILDCGFIDRDMSIEISEIQLAMSSLAVSVVCGSVPGIVVGKMGLPVWVVPPASFVVSWFVCEKLFTVAHDHYGAGSVWHRAYDMTSIGSGLLMYYLVKR